MRKRNFSDGTVFICPQCEQRPVGWPECPGRGSCYECHLAQDALRSFWYREGKPLGRRNHIFLRPIQITQGDALPT